MLLSEPHVVPVIGDRAADRARLAFHFREIVNLNLGLFFFTVTDDLSRCLLELTLVASQRAGRRRHAERADRQQPDGDRECGEIFIEQGG